MSGIVPNVSCLRGLVAIMRSRAKVKAQGVKELWDEVGRSVGSWLSSSTFDPLRHHEQFVVLLDLLHAYGRPIVHFNTLCGPLLQWIAKTPLKPSTFHTASPSDAQLSAACIPALEWILGFFKLASSASQPLRGLIVEHIVGILFNSNSLISPVLPLILPSVTPELEKKALTLNENVILKVLPIIMNWPTTVQVAEWTTLLITRLRFLITTQQSSKQEYHKQLTNWLAIVEAAIDVLCKNLYHRRTRNGAVRLLKVLFNSLQRSPKAFLRALPMLFDALTSYVKEMETVQTTGIAVHKPGALELPLNITAVVSYLNLLDMDNLQSVDQREKVAAIPYSIKSDITAKNPDLEETTNLLARLLLIQMHCHKGQPEAYIPVYELIREKLDRIEPSKEEPKLSSLPSPSFSSPPAVADANTSDAASSPSLKPSTTTDLISLQEIELHLNSESWNLKALKSTASFNMFAYQQKQQTATTVRSEGDEEDALEFSSLSNFDSAELSRPDSLKSVGLCGLTNLGNTCYMNSLVQVLFQTLAFRTAIFNAFTDPLTHLPTLPPANAPPLMRELQYTFASLIHTTRGSFAPTSLLSTLPSWIKGGRQHDASELEKAIFDILDTYWMTTLKAQAARVAKETAATSSPVDLNSIHTASPMAQAIVSPISQIFGGTTATTVRCKVCNTISERSEQILDLSLTFPEEDLGSVSDNGSNRGLEGAIDSRDGRIAIQDGNGHASTSSSMQVSPSSSNRKKRKRHSTSKYSLDDLIDHFMEIEDMEGANQYRCDACQRLVDAEKIISITTPPEHLIVNLVRFKYDYKTHTRSKILTEVDFNDYLELPIRASSYSSTCTEPRETTKMDVDGDTPVFEEIGAPDWMQAMSTVKVGYTLYGCVMHSGRSTDHGHYYSYARSSELLDPVVPSSLRSTTDSATTTAMITNTTTASSMAVLPAPADETFNDAPTSSSSSSSSSLDRPSASMWYRFNDEDVAISSFESFSKITKHFPADVAYILLFRRNSPSNPGPRPGVDIAIPQPIMKRVQEDNIKAEAERHSLSKSHRPTRQALFSTRSRFDDGPGGNHGGGDRYNGPGFGFGGGFGGGWVS